MQQSFAVFFLIMSSASITSEFLSDSIENKLPSSTTKTVINNQDDALRVHKQKNIALLCHPAVAGKDDRQERVILIYPLSGAALLSRTALGLSVSNDCRIGNAELR